MRISVYLPAYGSCTAGVSSARCVYCQLYLSPNKFIFHFHRVSGSRYHHPDAANFNSWRRHLSLDYVDPPEELVHAWEDVKAMFNGGSRKRLVSPPPASAKGRGSDSVAPELGDRRQDECAGRAKRQRVVEDRGRIVPASAVQTADQSSNCLLRPPSFYHQPPCPPLAGLGTSTNSSSQLHHPYTHPLAALPPPTSSTACVPYYDVIRMQMLAAAAASGDVWKARAAAAAAAAAVSGVCPLTPPLNMVWPHTNPPADFLSAVGRSRKPLEQFLAMSPSSMGHYRQLNHQRALATFDKSLRDGHCAHSHSPLPVARKPFSAFRLVSDVDDVPVLSVGQSSLPQDDVTSQVDINNVDDESRQRLDDNANRCDGDHDQLTDDLVSKNDACFLADLHSSCQQRNTNEVASAAVYI